MDPEDWITAMGGTDGEEEKEKDKEKDDGFKTPPTGSPRGKGEQTRTPPSGLSPTYSTPRSTPGTAGKLTIETEP